MGSVILIIDDVVNQVLISESLSLYYVFQAIPVVNAKNENLAIVFKVN